MKYEALYQRNIGIFSSAEQDKLRNSHVFVAGVGGVGGIQAVTLARMGVGEITIMDPGIFDEPDMNRQYASMASTIGKSKASATGEILQDVAPFARINIIEEKLDDIILREIIKKTNLVIDAIDMQDFNYKLLLARIAREEGKYSMTSPIPGLGTVMMIFDPDGMTFEEFTSSKCYPKNIVSLATGANFVDVDENSPFISDSFSNSGAAALSGALLATEAGLIITGKRAKSDLVTIPFLTYLDLYHGFLKIFNPLDKLAKK